MHAAGLRSHRPARSLAGIAVLVLLGHLALLGGLRLQPSPQPAQPQSWQFRLLPAAPPAAPVPVPPSVVAAAPARMARSHSTSRASAETPASKPNPSPLPAPQALAAPSPASMTQAARASGNPAPAAAATGAADSHAGLAPPPDVPVQLPSSSASYLDNPPPPYPPISRRLGEQGRVVLRVLIGTDGRAQQADIDRSSGFQRLDQAALDTVLRWRYVPGRRGGVPQDMWVRVPISFTLD